VIQYLSEGVSRALDRQVARELARVEAQHDRRQSRFGRQRERLQVLELRGNVRSGESTRYADIQQRPGERSIAGWLQEARDIVAGHLHVVLSLWRVT
jgi:hypothetical protein